MERPDDPRGALVRPYAVTRGRTEPQRDIAIEAVLVTTVRGKQEARFAGRDRRVHEAAVGRVPGARRGHGRGRAAGLAQPVGGSGWGPHGTAGKGVEWTPQALTVRMRYRPRSNPRRSCSRVGSAWVR